MRPRSPETTPARPPSRTVAVLTAVLLTSACGGGTTSPQDTAQPSPSPPTSAQASPTQVTPPSAGAAAPAGTAVTTADSEFGPMLFDRSGQAIYLFDRETTGRPDCYGDCAAAWPPVLTAGPPQPGGAVRAELLGTVARDDGSMQVTYAGHPLYFYAHEEPGQVLCHDVVDFGGRWLVVTPEGAPAP